MKGLGCIQTQLNLWTLKFEFKKIFTGHKDSSFDILQLLKNVKAILSAQTTQKQAMGKIWHVGCSLPDTGLYVFSIYFVICIFRHVNACQSYEKGLPGIGKILICLMVSRFMISYTLQKHLCLLGLLRVGSKSGFSLSQLKRIKFLLYARFCARKWEPSDL